MSNRRTQQITICIAAVGWFLSVALCVATIDHVAQRAGTDIRQRAAVISGAVLASILLTPLVFLAIAVVGGMALRRRGESADIIVGAMRGIPIFGTLAASFFRKTRG